ncbi:hypothetical protein ABT294_10665 [Nonomuraea sp. NPDC000554]|uniref:hypothetical protein n=1 Tax=Nonomuraea sp. NPDC000554 TaxID=3154259 RepID=UPI00331FDE9C
MLIATCGKGHGAAREAGLLSVARGRRVHRGVAADRHGAHCHRGGRRFPPGALGNSNTVRSYAVGVEKTAERIGKSRPLATVADDEVGDGLQGSHRSNFLVAARSLFTFCRKRRSIFRNPTRGIRIGRHPYGLVQRLNQDDIDQATKPGTRHDEHLNCDS